MPIVTLSSKIAAIVSHGPMTSGEFTAWKRLARGSNVVAVNPNSESVSYATLYSSLCDPSGVSVTSRLFDSRFPGA